MLEGILTASTATVILYLPILCLYWSAWISIYFAVSHCKNSSFWSSKAFCCWVASGSEKSLASALNLLRKMEHNQQEKDAREKAIDDWLPITSSRNAKWWYSAFHNVTAMVGAGVLSLPYAMAELGWYLSLIPLLLSSDKVKKSWWFYCIYFNINAFLIWLWLLWEWGFYYIYIDFFFPYFFGFPRDFQYMGFSGFSSHDVEIVNITDGSFM